MAGWRHEGGRTRHGIAGRGTSRLRARGPGRHTRAIPLQQMGATWGGCVEVRPSPHDVTDSVPNAQTPASLFVPMFNPDEPDTANNNGDSYGNNYLPDYGGTCPAPPSTCTAYKKDGVTCKTWSQPPVLSPKDAQARVCKYPGASISAGTSGVSLLVR